MNPIHIPHQTGNLLVVEFCDNDFSYNIKEALESLYKDTENIYNHSLDMIKRYLVIHVEAEMAKKSCLRNWESSSYREYLERITVSFRKDLPKIEPEGETVDHGGGSAAIDIVTGYAFTF